MDSMEGPREGFSASEPEFFVFCFFVFFVFFVFLFFCFRFRFSFPLLFFHPSLPTSLLIVIHLATFRFLSKQNLEYHINLHLGILVTTLVCIRYAESQLCTAQGVRVRSCT